MEKTMNLGNWLADKIIAEEKTVIKTIVAIYPGRFQPMGKHHAQAYKWLKSKFKDAHVVTSDKVDLPKSPFSFNEKKKIINSYGILNIVKVKNPYQATELLKKYDPKTTAAIFMVGEKDASRLGGKFFRPWKGKADVGYKDGAYTIIAPHVSLKVPGHGEMSGTAIRTSLGAKAITDKERAQLFKHIFGHMKNYSLITKKLGITESIANFIATGKVQKIIIENSNMAGSEVDDGPQTWYYNQAHYKQSTKAIAKKLGMQVLDYLSGDNEVLREPSRYNANERQPSYYPSGVPGKTSKTNPKIYRTLTAFGKWKKEQDKLANTLGYELLDYMGAEMSVGYPEPNTEDKTPTNIEEDITIPINIGDTVLGGKFKNKRIVVKHIGKNEKGDITINGRPLMKYRLIAEGLITEGGAYGHMSHPFDDRGLTFGEFKEIINISLQGKLDLDAAATEKTDGQNLFISWNNELRAARNAGDIKRGGMDARSFAAKWKGRGNIEKAFTYAFKDLSKAIQKLSDKQRNKIFGDGNNWMNMEIMYPASQNVIVYDAPNLQFHGVLKYEKGVPVGTVKDGARILAGMIKQVDANIQKNFSIIGPQVLKVDPHQDFGKKIPYFTSKLKKLMSKYNMKDSQTFAEYHQVWWETYIQKNFKNLDTRTKMGLVKRWAFHDKSFRLNKQNFNDADLLAKVIEFDKQKHKGTVQDTMKPFEVLFFELGAEVLKNVQGFLTVSPDKAVQHIKKQVSKAISDVRKGGDIKKLNRMGQQLSKLNAIGGWKAVIPSEGLVFIYKGKTYKLTGAFGPINQIAGMMTF
tara:strand:- start:97 stop:2508 length:2412 start_codon:yes stop_codon:yes gene_type:complete